jgi:hypothetical protein
MNNVPLAKIEYIDYNSVIARRYSARNVIKYLPRYKGKILPGLRLCALEQK